MAVIIDEVEVEVQQPPAANTEAVPAAQAGAGAGEIDEQALQAWLARAAWRAERLRAD
jgi:hypothetical protein